MTKFLGKISQFEFLVITQKIVFAYKLFLSLNISDFNLLCDHCTLPSEKVTPHFPSNPPLKVEVLSSPPFFKIWFRGSTPLPYLQTETWVINRVITYSPLRTLEFKSCPVFPLWPESSIEVWLTDRQAGQTGEPKDKHVVGSNIFETSYI